MSFFEKYFNSSKTQASSKLHTTLPYQPTPQILFLVPKTIVEQFEVGHVRRNFSSVALASPTRRMGVRRDATSRDQSVCGRQGRTSATCTLSRILLHSCVRRMLLLLLQRRRENHYFEIAKFVFDCAYVG